MAAPYPRRQSNTWYLANWPYRVFMLRELSAVFLALYTVLLLVLVTKVHAGPAAFADWVDTLRSPPLIVFHVIVMAFALLHSVTWFQAVPKGLPLRRGEEPVSPRLVIGANYALLVIVTVVIVAIARF
jgi:fumarate reductase subunit C